MKSQLNGGGGQPAGLSRLSNELHPGLGWGSPPLALIAGLAGGDDVFPGLLSILNHRDDVIQGEVIFVESIPAILAGVLIAKEDVRAGKSHDLLLLGEWDIREQAKDRGDFDRQPNRVHFPVRLLDDFHFSLKKQLQCALPGDDVQWFERGVEH